MLGLPLSLSAQTCGGGAVTIKPWDGLAARARLARRLVTSTFFGDFDVRSLAPLQGATIADPRVLADRVFGVGCAKSGTHALAALLGPRAAHEPDAEAMLRLVLARERGELDRGSFERLLRQLIDRRDLDADISQINGVVVETLVGLYPGARFILTIREPGAWLRSFVNHQLTTPNPAGSAWGAFREFRFATPPTPPTAEDASLAVRGLYAVDAYLGYWRRHNARVLAAVSPPRLLVAPTAGLDASRPALAAFLGRPDLIAAATQPRVFEGRYAPSPLDALDREWLEGRIRWHAEALIADAGDRLAAEIIAALRPPR